MKKGLKYLLIIISIFLLIGCGREEDNAYTFDEGDFKITLTTDFSKKSLGTTKYYYEHSDKVIGVTVNEETFEQYKLANVEVPNDVKEYADFVIKANGLINSKSSTKKDYATFSYEKTVSGSEFYYYAVAFKGEKGYFLINFFCKKDKKDEYQSNFERWANTISVK